MSADSRERALAGEHPGIPTLVRPPNTAAAKAAFRDITVLSRLCSLRSGVAKSIPVSPQSGFVRVLPDKCSRTESGG